MAIIGEIRKRPGILVGVIAVSIVLFLLGVAVNDQFSVLRPGRNTDAGSVDGEAIPYNDYSTKLTEDIKNIETQQKMSLNDVQRNYMNKQTWDEMVNKIIMDHTCQKTGLAVSDDEMVALTMTENLHPMIRQQLFGNNPVDVAGLNNFIKNLDIDDKGQTEHGAKRKFWNNIVKEVNKSQLQSKYNALVSKGIGNVPKWMAENYYEETNKTSDFRCLYLPYTDVNDNDIKYTDNDLKEYLDKNAAKYTSPDEVRKIQYVAFDVVPSAIDSATVLKSLNDKLEEFAKGEKKTDDSIFVKINSETPFVDLYKIKDAPGNTVPDSFYTLPLKTVVGPYVENGAYKYAKISAHKMMSDSIKVREITFSYANVKTEAEFKTKLALFDSLYTAIDSLHADFATLAATNTDDPATKATGGDMGWVKFADNTTDEQYKEIVFHNGVVGKTYKYYMRQENGQAIPVKLIQIVEDKPSKPGVKVAYFSHPLQPSQETENNIYSSVTQFASANSTEAKFKQYAKDHKAAVVSAAGITKENYDVTGLQSARAIVKWAFDAKRGDISPIKTVDNSLVPNGRKHIIAYLEAITGKGAPDLESVKDMVKFDYLHDKKYEILAKKITDAKASSIDDLSTKLGKPIQEETRTIFANPNISSGREPSVVAVGVYIAPGKLSGPVKGTLGVYAVQKTGGVDPPAATDLTRAALMAQQLGLSKARGAQDALKKLSKVNDNRLNFEINN